MKPFIYKTKEEFHQHRNVVFVVFVFCMMVALSFFATRDMDTSVAADLNNFNPGNIISDAVMGDYRSMTVAEIQDFLSRKNSCDNRNYDLYLQYTSAHPSITWHWEGEPYNGHFVCLAEERFGDGEVIGSGMTAAEIIYDAAQKNKINPQVLIVLLQKESSLITDKVPNSHDYRQATGYGCPDTAACDSKFYGFKNQIYRAAELFRYTLDNGYALYPDGKEVYVGYHPSTSCGGSVIKIENRATSALYRYTPYQPNDAALGAGYGTGNACSAYGNRNFYLYFTDWFGSTQAKVEGELAQLPDGVYSFSLVADQAKLSVPEGQNVKNGANVAVLPESQNKSNFKIQKVPNTQYYQIIDVASGKALDLASAKTAEDTNVQLWQQDINTCAQKWKFYQTSQRKLVIESSCMAGMVLSVDGQNVQLGLVKNGQAHQQWQISVGQTLADSTYQISPNQKDNFLLQYSDNDYKNGTKLFAKTESRADVTSRWVLSYDRSGDYYTIKNAASGKVIDLSNAQTTNNTKIQLWQQDTNTCAQKWQIIPSLKEGAYHIVSMCSSSYGLGWSSSDDNVSLQASDSVRAATWSFTLVEPEVANGEYHLASASNQNYVLDVSGGRTTNGTNIQGWSIDYNAGAQNWLVQYDDKTDTYTLKNPQSNKVMDLSNAKTINGGNVQIWSLDTNTCAQKWIFDKMANNEYAIHSACDYSYVLDLSNNRTTNGNNIQIWQQDLNTSAQKWILQPIQ